LNETAYLLGYEDASSFVRAFRTREGLRQEVHMPARNDALKDRLSRYREINISVTGRKSGRAISIPVWFVLEGDKLYLLPVQGSDTQWYKNVLKNPSIRIDARGGEAKLQALPITDATGVSSVVEKFRAKYGTGDVKKYYSKFDVAVLVPMR
jgi:deazaflavin-dependent oxidoreductase (nitroreductase family)